MAECGRCRNLQPVEELHHQLLVMVLDMALEQLQLPVQAMQAGNRLVVMCHISHTPICHLPCWRIMKGLHKVAINSSNSTRVEPGNSSSEAMPVACRQMLHLTQSLHKTWLASSKWSILA